MSVKTTTFVLISILFVSCWEQPLVINTNTLFSEVPLTSAGIDFVNELNYTEEFNIYTFRNFYNGAGVGLGDFNNDGYVDVFFCGNQVDNKLYLNHGNFKFEDITQSAQVSSKNVWTTGVSIVDINGDGWLDIYVCKSGDNKGENRHNELFINQGLKNGANSTSITFTEESNYYGLDDLGLSTHAAFFDYDRDGDLDCYLLNNSFRSIGNYDLRPDQRDVRDSLGGNKLFRNNTIGKGIKENDKIFEDVSEEAGIYGSSIGFGLGVAIGDLDNDGWPDIHVSNDFFEKDYLYINQKNGRFKESVDDKIGELSMGSMGADIADLNNDGLPEIFVTEMLPKDESRAKTKSLFENWNKYESNVDKGYHHQFSRNVLQVNMGGGEYREMGRMAGVEATDWSWGALLFDMNNDGLKDIFVANGIFKDLLDQDYINFYSNPEEVRKILFAQEKGGLDKLVDMIPSEPLSNYAFKNKGDLQFENSADEWGLNKKTFSNGASYGDLDNDGDLDLVVNNINMPPIIYKNNSTEQSGSHFIQFKLIDTTSHNYYAIGAKVTIYESGKEQSLELFPARGFMSSVDTRISFAVTNRVDSMVVKWPDGTFSNYKNLKIDELTLIFKNGDERVYNEVSEKMGTSVFKYSEFQFDFKHNENDYSDFDREPLLIQMHSNLGPSACSGDINNDGLEDFYMGGANGQSGALFIQRANGSFQKINVPEFTRDSSSEDVACIFYNANNDNLLDLYVASGSSEYGPNNAALMDRLYINRGEGRFSKSNQILPTFNFENSSSVVALDADADGDQDLIVTTFIRPYTYGVASNIYLLENDGAGKYMDVTSSKANGFLNLGMVTDIVTSDVDGDDDLDVIVVGEWMSPTIFENKAGRFSLKANTGLDSISGLWNVIESYDLDNDGLEDLIIGNHGLNSRLKASSKYPLRMYIGDFDKNGKVEQIYTYSNENGEFPLAQRTDLLKQLPYLNRKYQDFKSYANQQLHDIFVTEDIENTIRKDITELKSIIAYNRGNGVYEIIEMPIDAQISTINAIAVDDINDDDITDIIIGGNQYRVKPEIGINDGSLSQVLIGSNNRTFESIDIDKSGILIKGEIRNIIVSGEKNKRKFIFFRNNDYPVVYEKQK